MRCDPDHHGVAVGARSDGSHLHHYAFELEGWAAMAHYADHIARMGQQFLWGPGRHGPGFNQFTYLPDPDGAILEVYSDLLRIDNDAAYEPIDWSTEPRSMNLWGPQMPDGWNELGVPVLAPASTNAHSLR
jgi:catechol-2,3-dioxygenase